MNEFVRQVDNPALINLFLTELNDEDTTFSYYKDHYLDRINAKDVNSNYKVVRNETKLRDVCTKLIEICENLDCKKYFLVILSCFAKMKELEKALFKIIQSKGNPV
jgi:hypothetical protein